MEETKEDDERKQAAVTVTPPTAAGVTATQTIETTLPLGVHHQDY